MDIQAINEILDVDGLETHVMPGNVAAAMTFDMERCKNEFSGRNDLTNFLYMRWVNHMDGGRYQRTIWDLSVISAILFSDWVKEIKVAGPPENGSHSVYVYKNLQAEKMIDEFYSAIRLFFNNE